MTMVAVIAAIAFLAQTSIPEDQERRLVNTSFRQARAAESVPSPIMVGVTLFRLRAPAAADPDQSRRLVHEESGEQPYTLERVTQSVPIRNRERVIVHIESSRKGYLYVVSQEQYADGSSGTPELVFPTTRIRGGDNSVRAGQAVELPASTDIPPYWRLVQSRPDHISELLTILISPHPLAEVKAARSPISLPPALFERWKKSFATETKVVETNPKPAAATAAENAVASGKPLGQNDPAPQTIYRAITQEASSLLVRHAIRFRVSP